MLGPSADVALDLGGGVGDLGEVDELVVSELTFSVGPLLADASDADEAGLRQLAEDDGQVGADGLRVDVAHADRRSRLLGRRRPLTLMKRETFHKPTSSSRAMSVWVLPSA